MNSISLSLWPPNTGARRGSDPSTAFARFSQEREQFVWEPRLPAGVAPSGQCAGARRQPPTLPFPQTQAPVPGWSHRREGGRVPLKRETPAAREVGPCPPAAVRACARHGGGAGAVGMRAGGGAQALVLMAASPADASRRRREKRRQLDARRSKCRIRLGGHMEQWCLLKERLGFSLHSQLAKFLLDRYTSSGCVLCAGPEPVAPKGLQYLVLLSHAHSRECSLVPGLRGPGGQDGGLVWECSAGHTFSWGPSSGPKSPEEPNLTPLPSTDERSWCPEARNGQEPAGLESKCDERAQEARMPRGVGPPPETFPSLGEDGEEEEEDEEEMLSDASPWTYSSSPDEKAAKRELLPCDFPGCGRIFSNRQYLNHHKKYQHIHQKSFSCPEPACGKSFNFKKHLKEHVKLHSDTRDYICEFCARSFRTSSNLVIHRRIHTGEKPLQCEICGFTCRQKASLNWHRRKHAETVAALRFPCEFCGKRFEKPDSVAAHCSKSHPALLLAPQELSGPLESCSSILASESLGASEGSRSSLAPQAPMLLP
ncbi:zinc finger protein 692 isoform X5 [Moschus berezovskii]|uniref:zinc finger protein 692 isoform X5 n=1 Tax=Moschus berezovskii TaxID=68408 RepID=UPI00244505F3|nr:zinc finger protein 692 isoform X5 [Moschus berezovskii]